MELFLVGHDYKYAVEQIMLMLFPQERPSYPESPGEGISARVSLGEDGEKYFSTTLISLDGQSWEGYDEEPKRPGEDELVSVRLHQRVVRMSFYRAGIKLLGKKPVWGSLCGVRPCKLMSDLLEQGLEDEKALEGFMELYDVDPDRAGLCLHAAHASTRAKDSLGEKDVCLYLGVPFCPTRCAYCSFVSQSVERSMKLIPGFVEALLKDIRATGEALAQAGLNVVSVYFGGGTPTTLSAEQLDTVCSCMEESFDLSHCREFTVEAGRPDTITEEKLLTLRRHGVTRVSVNPQTMNDHVLDTIGRRHSGADVLRAVDCVRTVGGFELNMDLIAGLPEDTPESFAETMEKVLSLAPDNITVHTLSLKKGSRITLESTRIPTPEEVGEMLEISSSRLSEKGYLPYYLYRQKFMSGGFENVSWCLPGRENLYNICIMEELCSIIAMGGGASTKLVGQKGEIKRFFAPKYPTEYIANIDQVCADKTKIKEFYHELSAE